MAAMVSVAAAAAAAAAKATATARRRRREGDGDGAKAKATARRRPQAQSDVGREVAWRGDDGRSWLAGRRGGSTRSETSVKYRTRAKSATAQVQR